MIEGFVLPERLAGSSENLIRDSGAGALDGSRDLAKRLARVDQYVDMVRHDHPGEQFAEFPFLFGDEERLDYCVGDASVV